ncbi:MAG: VPLPA-CTERM sorting domain-containing protein [Neptuniibacter sp.]
MLKKIIAFGFFLQICSFTANAASAPVMCLDSTKNHMNMDSAVVSSCLAAGPGNLTGNPKNDPFLLNVGSSFVSAGKTDDTNPFNLQYTELTKTKSKATGTFSIDATFWDTYSAGAIGFKFGTGSGKLKSKKKGKKGKKTKSYQSTSHDWFVYQLVAGTTSGEWEFINALCQAGDLSHMNLYGVEKLSPVPVPAAIPLFLSALAAFGLFRRRQRKQA